MYRFEPYVIPRILFLFFPNVLQLIVNISIIALLIDEADVYLIAYA